jgi:hypothetical protein
MFEEEESLPSPPAPEETNVVELRAVDCYSKSNGSNENRKKYCTFAELLKGEESPIVRT